MISLRVSTNISAIIRFHLPLRVYLYIYFRTVSKITFNFDPKKRIELKLQYYQEDFFKIWACDIAIREHIEKGTDIPSDVLKQFYSVFEKPMEDDMNAKAQLIKNATENILLLAKELKYNFKIQVKYPKKKEIISTLKIQSHYGVEIKSTSQYTIREYSLENFLVNFFSAIRTSDRLYEIVNDKNLFIQEAYKSLQHYIHDIPKKQALTVYAQTVIIGILAVNFGLLHTKEAHNSSPSHTHYTEYLSNGTKYICKKTNK